MNLRWRVFETESAGACRAKERVDRTMRRLDDELYAQLHCRCPLYHCRYYSFVRYQPDSRFSAYPHSGDEEFIVLEGTFSDEHGAYPKGIWVRSPPGSRHTPFTKQGCTIYVKTGHPGQM